MSEMGRTTDRFYSHDSVLLIPCDREYDCGGKSKKSRFTHSVTGNFMVENAPLKIDTIVSVGSVSKLKSYLKSKLGIDISKDPEYSFSFEGVSGLTFPCTDSEGVSYVVIWMPKFEWSVSDMEVLSHECLHASVMVMRESGMKARIFSARKEEDVDDEGLAYRSSSMFSGILMELVKRQHSNYRKSMTRKLV